MKKVNFGAKRPSLAGKGSIDEFVGHKEPTKRLTIDVPVSLHKRVKSRCAMDNLVMADVIREFLEQRFPHPTDGEHGVPS